jgi:hypothetical protein
VALFPTVVAATVQDLRDPAGGAIGRWAGGRELARTLRLVRRPSALRPRGLHHTAMPSRAPRLPATGVGWRHRHGATRAGPGVPPSRPQLKIRRSDDQGA